MLGNGDAITEYDLLRHRVWWGKQSVHGVDQTSSAARSRACDQQHGAAVGEIMGRVDPRGTRRAESACRMHLPRLVGHAVEPEYPGNAYPADSRR